MDVKKIKIWISDHPIVAYPLLALGAFLIWSVIMMFTESKPNKSPKEVKGSELIGMSVGGADEKAYLARLEKSSNDFEDRIKKIESRMKTMSGVAQELKDNQKHISQVVLKLDEGISTKLSDQFEKFKAEIATAHVNPTLTPQVVELSVADIGPIVGREENNAVYLPMGSFCKGTLLTGVYATADQNSPLPVLISLDEAFYGPNQSRIPLKGAFILGKAYGDLVSERALIQIIAISSVLPNSVTFENEQNLGYVTDAYGELGIKGQVIRNTGSQLALSFMGGFMSGGSQALADQEISERREGQEPLIREVTGNASKHAIFSGLAASAGKMSEYYSKQAENLIPAIHIRNGQDVYFIVQKGVTIDGLSRIDLPRAHYMD